MSWWQNDAAVGDASNITRFLDFLGKAEGADYNTIVGGSKFNSYAAHPNVVGLRTADGPSTAAGRYQITGTTYRDVAPKLGISDFSPESQDAIAIELIRRNGAFDDVAKGDFNTAINKLGKTWASLPSSPYSQPKKSWDQVNKMLGVQMAANNNWWANDAPVSDAAPSTGGGNWWAGDATVEAPAPAAPQASPKAAPATAAARTPAAPAKKEEPRGVMRRVDDFVRGVADTVTFGYADEIAAKLDSVFGGGQSGLKSYDAALAAQRERDKQGGAERIAGQIGGALLPGAGVVGAVRAAPTAGLLGRVGAGAATGAIQGGLYGSGSAEGDLEDRVKGAAIGAGTGAAVGGVLGGVLRPTTGQKVESFVRNSGDEARAATDAEILRRARAVFDDPNRMTGKGAPVISAAELNGKVTESFLREAKDVVASLPKDFAGKKELTSAITQGRRLEPAAIDALRTSPAGDAVADIILAAQRADKLTAALPARGGLLGTAARTAIDAAPAALSASTGIPVIVGSTITEGLKQKLGGRVSREGVIQRMLEKQSGVADDVLARTGPAAAVSAKEALAGIADKAIKAQASKVSASQVSKEAAKTAAEQLRIRNLQLGIRSNPGFQPENLQITGGTRGTLQYYGRLADSKELAKGLRMIEKTDPYLAPYIKQVQQNKNVPNKEILLGLTDRLKQMRDQGILKPYMKQ